MTIQIQDSLLWTEKSKNRTFSIFSVVSEQGNSSILFDPREYGITPQMHSTGCYRGCYAQYGIRDSTLVLDTFSVYTNGNYPPLNGIAAVSSDPDTEAEGWPVFYIYSGLDMKIPFTGRLMGGEKLITRHPWWPDAPCFRKVMCFCFEHGRLLKVENLNGQLRLLKKLEHRVHLFRGNNWLTKEWEDRLRLLSYDGIERILENDTTGQSSKEIDAAIATIEELKVRPEWFLSNFRDHYERGNNYEFGFGHLEFLGCPRQVTDFLKSLVMPEITAEHVVVAFLQALKQIFSEDVLGETLGVIIGRRFARNGIPPELYRCILDKYSSTTGDSW